MGAFSPQKFVDPETLKRVSFKNLVLLLTTTANGYLFQKREDGKPARMALADEESAFDFDLLVDVLLTPEEGYPDELADALYHIAEIADSDGIHQLQGDLRDTLAVAELGDEPSHADLALHAWLKHRDAVERVMGRQFLLRPKSFITYLGPSPEGPDTVALDEAWRLEIETYLAVWFKQKVDSPFVRVLPYDRGDSIWFLVRHAQKAQRRGVIKETGPTSTVERPDKYDIVVYTPGRDELALHADTKGERELYASAFGMFLFSGLRKFTDKGKYTLAPLLDGPDCLDAAGVAGIQSVVLRQIQVGWGGAYNDIETRSSDDIFASLKARNATVPSKGLFSATFDVLFTDAKRARKLTIRTPSTAKYDRKGDKDSIDEWMTLRKFIRPKV